MVTTKKATTAPRAPPTEAPNRTNEIRATTVIVLILPSRPVAQIVLWAANGAHPKATKTESKATTINSGAESAHAAPRSMPPKLLPTNTKPATSARFADTIPAEFLATALIDTAPTLGAVRAKEVMSNG